MDVQLQELLETIKKDGLKAAEEEAKTVLDRAEKRAEEIVEKARKEAEGLIEDAKREAEKVETSGREALKQAGRDLILSINKRIVQIFSSLVQREAGSVLTGKALEKAVISLISSWSKEQVGDLSLLIPQKDWEVLEKELRQALSEELKRGLEIKPGKNITSGFKVTMKNGSAYYNFTDSALAEALCEYLNPRLSELLMNVSEQKD